MTNEELVKEYQNGKYEVLDELMMQNKGLVMYFANKYAKVGSFASYDFDDLEQEGWIGFLDAASKFRINEPMKIEDDPTMVEMEQVYSDIEKQMQQQDTDEVSTPKTVMFCSYAGKVIQNRILRSINKNIPREKKSDTSGEIIHVNSIDALLPGTKDATLEEFLPSDEATSSFKDIERNMDNEILRKDLLEMLDTVFGGEFEFDGYNLVGVDNVISLYDKLADGITTKEVLLLHYGLFGKPMTYSQIGEKVGVSGTRIQQMETKGLYAIRNSEQGKVFMKKYKDEVIESLQQKRSNLNQFATVDKICESMETLDIALKNILAMYN